MESLPKSLAPDPRRELWNLRVEADMRQRYFSQVAQMAHQRDRVLRVAVFFTSSATAATALVDLGVPPELFASVTAFLDDAGVNRTLRVGPTIPERRRVCRITTGSWHGGRAH